VSILGLVSLGPLASVEEEWRDLLQAEVRVGLPLVQKALK